MTRRRPPERLDQISEAALEVFARRGLLKTRMSDIAGRAGVSQGLLYTYVESKDALFHHVIERIVAGGAIATPHFPIPTPGPGVTARLIDKALRDGFSAFATLESAAVAPVPDDPRAELEGVVRELYQSVERWRDLIRLLESTAADRPATRRRFYAEGRRPFLAQISLYLQRRIDAGVFRPVPDTDVAARLVLETVMWFAAHRHHDRDSADFDATTTRETVVAMLTAAVVA